MRGDDSDGRLEEDAEEEELLTRCFRPWEEAVS